MHFPVEDVVRNIRYFLSSVKKVTGNSKDDDRKSKTQGGAKPGMSLCLSVQTVLKFISPTFSVATISRVMLSSRQGPGIRLSDW